MAWKRTLILETIFLTSFMAFAANATDNKPTPASKCGQAAKGCTSNSIDAKCSVMACKAKGCKSEFDSGECKTLKDLHKAASCGLLAADKCGKKLPRVHAGGLAPAAPPVGALLETTSTGAPGGKPSGGDGEMRSVDTGEIVAVSSRDKLQSGIRVGSDRIRSIQVGEAAVGRVQSSLAKINQGNEFVCSGGAGCICIGDTDCNDMFSTICRDNSIPAGCATTPIGTICTCSPFATME